MWIGGAGLWLLWPAVSLVLVAANYAVLGPEGFQKDADGRMSLAARASARALSGGRLRQFASVDAARTEAGRDRRRCLARAHSPGARGRRLRHRRRSVRRTAGRSHGRNVDVHPDARSRPAATGTIAGRRGEHRASALRGPVLVCCALGYSRSAATVATWLVTTNRAGSMSEAIEKVRQARPRIVIDTALRAAIATATARRA